jgi:hypothetical protein
MRKEHKDVGQPNDAVLRENYSQFRASELSYTDWSQVLQGREQTSRFRRQCVTQLIEEEAWLSLFLLRIFSYH